MQNFSFPIIVWVNVKNCKLGMLRNANDADNLPIGLTILLMTTENLGYIVEFPRDTFMNVFTARDSILTNCSEQPFGEVNECEMVP